MRRLLVTMTVAVSLSGLSLPAQSPASHPDFSGKWTLLPDDGVKPSAPLWSRFSAVQGSSSLAITVDVPSSSVPSVWPQPLVFRLDGSDSVNPATDIRGNPITLTFRSTWASDALNIATIFRLPSGEFSDSLAFSRESTGLLDVVELNTLKWCSDDVRRSDGTCPLHRTDFRFAKQ